MIKIRTSCENEMLAVYLGEEAKSVRYKEQIENVCKDRGADISVILNPDIGNDSHNMLRKDIMRSFRGYPDTDMFERFPKINCWTMCECEKEDLERIYYINYCYWNDISKNTGKPSEAAKTINEGIRIYDVPNDNFLNGAKFLNHGVFPPIILITCDDEKYLCIEGHSRVTSYALSPDKFSGTKALVGKCSKEDLVNYDKRSIFE